VARASDRSSSSSSRIIISGFIKAEILDMPEQPTEDEEMPLDDEHDLSLALATLTTIFSNVIFLYILRLKK
jgi:hypothetical protein